MKKKCKNLVGILLMICLSFLVFQLPQAKAANAGSATVGFTANKTNVQVGDNVVFTMKISNISTTDTDGVASIGGNIVFDTDYLDFVSQTSATNGINFSYMESTKKFAWVYSGTGIKTNTNLMNFTFKTKKIGTTAVTINNLLVSDTIPNKLTGTVSEGRITIGERKSNNAFLTSLSVVDRTITPAFNKNTTSYSLTVPNDVSSITVNATKEDTKATITGTGNVNLNVGVNNVNVVVTAEDGSKKTYTIKVTRQATEVPKSSDNTLSGLNVNGYSLSPAFNKDVTNYTLKVPNAATEVIVNAIKNDSKATVAITGADNLKVGENTVSVVVTAEDGSKKTYTIKVTREEKTETPVLSGDATLKSLSISGQTLKPGFNKNTNVYSISVGEKVTSLDVKAIPTDSKSKVTITGNKSLEYGINQVSVLVEAENGTKNIYIINVTREAPKTNTDPVVKKSGDNYLKSLNIKGVELNPAFNKDLSNYNIKIPYEVDLLDIDYAASSSKAKVEVVGNGNFKVGEVSTVQVKVTAEDGSVRIYTLNVNKDAVASNNLLKSLTIKDHNISPSFDKDIDTYNIKVDSNVDSIDIVATPENEKAKVEITGNNNLKNGNNAVLIKVTDENGFTRIYQLNVEKKSGTIFGMTVGEFIAASVIGAGTVGLVATSAVLLHRRKLPIVPQGTQQAATPMFEFKPEFNFGSKNGTDDDIVYPNAVLNQDVKPIAKQEEPPKIIGEVKAELPYDPYDDVVTKDELIDAIKEGIDTNNPEKLKMLLKQEELNKLKDKVKTKDRSSIYSDDD